MTELGKFVVGDPESQPPDIDELAERYKGFRNIPVTYEYAEDSSAPVVFTAESLMRGFCQGQDPEAVSDEKFKEILQNIASGKGHGG